MRSYANILFRDKSSLTWSLLTAALAWSGAINYLLGSTPLAAWKQLIAMILWVWAYHKCTDPIGVAWLNFGAFATALLTVWSIAFQDIAASVAIYNSFYFTAWIPIWQLASHDGYSRLVEFRPRIWIAVLILSTLGMLTDLWTGAFEFLNADGVSHDYLQENEIAKRVTFFFVAKTMVTPLMSFLAIISLDQLDRPSERLLIAACLLLSAIASGSASSIAVAILFCAPLLLIGKGLMSTIPFYGVVIALGIAMYAYVGDSEVITRQLERIAENRHADSEANVGRIIYFEEAQRDILSLEPLQLLFGAGLGATNDNLGNQPKFGHGESSIFQGMLEAGILGVALRVLPFLILLYLTIQGRYRLNSFLLLAWTISSFAAISLAPTFGNLPFQFALGVLMGRRSWELRLRMDGVK